MSGLDHGELNVPLSKRYGKGGIDAEIDRQLLAQHRERVAEYRARLKAARDAEAARVPLTRDDVEGARFVRDRFGFWNEVVTVNAKTVTVKTPHSWTDRIAIDKIHEVRR